MDRDVFIIAVTLARNNKTPYIWIVHLPLEHFLFLLYFSMFLGSICWVKFCFAHWNQLLPLQLKATGLFCCSWMVSWFLLMFPQTFRGGNAWFLLIYPGCIPILTKNWQFSVELTLLENRDVFLLLPAFLTDIPRYFSSLHFYHFILFIWASFVGLRSYLCWVPWKGTNESKHNSLWEAREGSVTPLLRWWWERLMSRYETLHHSLPASSSHSLPQTVHLSSFQYIQPEFLIPADFREFLEGSR